jgi:serine protease inhibitor
MTAPSDSVYRDLKPVEVRLVEADNRFGSGLFKEIISREKNSNVFVSPLSVALALGMAYNGAAGETKDAMQQTL